MAQEMMVRLKPYDPSKGHLRKTWSVFGWKQGFAEGDWHRIPAPNAEYLRLTAKANNGRGAPCAFDICTVDEAKEVIRREKMERLGRTIDHGRPQEIHAPPDAGHTLADDFNAGEPEHDLELAPDPTALLKDPPAKPKARKPAARRSTTTKKQPKAKAKAKPRGKRAKK